MYVYTYTTHVYTECCHFDFGGPLFSSLNNCLRKSRNENNREWVIPSSRKSTDWPYFYNKVKINYHRNEKMATCCENYP
jgi:hypothetical protein